MRIIKLKKLGYYTRSYISADYARREATLFQRGKWLTVQLNLECLELTIDNIVLLTQLGM